VGDVNSQKNRGGKEKLLEREKKEDKTKNNQRGEEEIWGTSKRTEGKEGLD